MIYTIRHQEILVDEFEVEAESEPEALQTFMRLVEEGWINFDRMEIVECSDTVVGSK